MANQYSILESIVRQSWDTLSIDEKVDLHMAANFPDVELTERCKSLFAPGGRIHSDTKRVIKLLAKETPDDHYDNSRSTS